MASDTSPTTSRRTFSELWPPASALPPISGTIATSSGDLAGSSATAPPGVLLDDTAISRPTTPTNSQLNSSLLSMTLQSPPSTAKNQESSRDRTVPSISSGEYNVGGFGNDTRSQPVNNGTGAHTSFRRFEDSHHDEFETMEIITRNPEFSEFSLEELRVVDYAQGRTAVRSETRKSGFLHGGPSAVSRGDILHMLVFLFIAPLLLTSLPATQNRVLIKNRLKGPNIKIAVGSETASAGQQETWCLPQSLISHHSLFFKAACSHDFREKEENRILLADENPHVFSLFVEWMYYNKYALSRSYLFNADLKAWILGDKLMATAFKNHAMRRLYEMHHIDNPLGASVTPSMVAFVCQNTVEGAKLRQFYIDFVVTHFSNPHKVAGGIEEWDSVLMDFDDLRMALFTAMRSSNQISRVDEKKFYLEQMSPSNSNNSGGNKVDS